MQKFRFFTIKDNKEIYYYEDKENDIAKSSSMVL